MQINLQGCDVIAHFELEAVDDGLCSALIGCVALNLSCHGVPDHAPYRLLVSPMNGHEHEENEACQLQQEVLQPIKTFQNKFKKL